MSASAAPGGCRIMKVKFVTGHSRVEKGGVLPSHVVWEDVEFTADENCRDYDWAVVYEDFPRAKHFGSTVDEREPLACPKENTILVTCEPPTIKLYPRYYTRQFGYVLTTQLPRYLSHPRRVEAPGCLLWMAGYSVDEARAMPEYEKTQVLSTVCSIKRQKHTAHNDRFEATRYLAEHLPELDWYGRGVRTLAHKYDALSPYKYHLAAENYVASHHWTDKIADPLLGLCLTFYAGDPDLAEVFPEESFIPVPLGDPEATLAIMREAIRGNEYEKRLPALREARRLLVTKYNIFAQVSRLVHEVEEGRRAGTLPPASPAGEAALCGRHRLRRNPVNAVEEFTALLGRKLSFKLHPRGHFAPGEPDR